MSRPIAAKGRVKSWELGLFFRRSTSIKIKSLILRPILNNSILWEIISSAYVFSKITGLLDYALLADVFDTPVPLRSTCTRMAETFR